MSLAELVFVSFGKYVVALDRATGYIRWQWRIPKGKSYLAMLLDGEQLFVSAMGYTYCLDAYTGRMIWENELSGLGFGVACIATSTGNTSPMQAAASAVTQQQAASSAH